MLLNTLKSERVHRATLQRIAALSPDAKRRWGTMSVSGMVCHLASSFEVALGEKSCAARAEPLGPTVVKFIALRMPLPWVRGYQTLPELVEGAPGMQPGAFEAEHLRLRSALQRFVEARTLAAVHPIFGPMSRRDWLRWGYCHVDHHLRQFGL